MCLHFVCAVNVRDETPLLDPALLLEQGWDRVRKEESIKGSCTVCLIVLDRESGTIRCVANLLYCLLCLECSDQEPAPKCV